MLRIVGRAGIVTDSGDPAKITDYLRNLGPEELVEEFHRAVVTLDKRNMLTEKERSALKDYASDWVASQPLG